MSKTLVIAEKPSVGQDLARVLTGSVQEAGGLPRGSRGGDHLGGGSPGAAGRAGRVRPQVQELADARPADRARALQAGGARRALAQADVGRHQTARPRGRRRGRQRLRRRARGRADLRLPVREGQGEEAGETAVAELDDERGDEGGASRGCARRRSSRARAGRQIALGGRLDSGHERHARGDHPAAQLLRRRGVAGARADADARDHRSPRGGDQGLQARALLARGRDVRGRARAGCGGRRRADLQRALSAWRPGPREGATARGSPPRRRRSRSSRRAWQRGHDHEAREEGAARESADAVRPDDAAAGGEQPLRVLRQADARGGAAAVRGAQGAHLPAHELALSDERHGRGDQADRRAGGDARRSTARAPST